MLQDIEHTAILASNPTPLVQWYCDILGFEIVTANESSGQYFIRLPGGGILEFLRANDNARTEHANNDAGIRHIAFTVEDYDATTQALEDRGVVFQSPHAVASDGGKRNFFPDPEGNVLQLVWRPEPLG